MTPPLDTSTPPADRPHRPWPWRTPGWPQAGDRFALGRLLVREAEYGAIWRRVRGQGLDASLRALETTGLIDEGWTRAQRRALGVEAGFEGHVAAWTTPLPDPAWLETLRARGDLERAVVLLGTGSYAPAHAGHFAMLAAAQAALEAHGHPVLAVYLSPSHDLYVAGKDGGRCAAYPGPLRVDLLRTWLQAHPPAGEAPWLVCPWEALLAQRATNFTTVRRRLQAYLTQHLGVAVPVVYAFGADNAAFAEAFRDAPAPACVTVGRHGRRGQGIGLFAPLDHAGSSTAVRDGTLDGADTVLARAAAPEGTYFLRDEGCFAWQAFARGENTPALCADAWATFVDTVEATLQAAFATGGPAARPDTWARLDAATQQAQVQAWVAQGRVATPPFQMVSLDPVMARAVPGVTHLPLSRLFAVADHQARARDWTTRPGHAALVAVREGMPVVLIDDDQATGATLKRGASLLERQHVRVVEARVLTPPDARVFDVVDARDFLPGTADGGLVVQSPAGSAVRVPYLAPFVDLSTRARLPAGTAWHVSRTLWGAARTFFAALPTPIALQDLAPAAQAGWLAQGWAPETSLEALCAHWEQTLAWGHPAAPRLAGRHALKA